LVGITPAAGFVGPMAAIAIGLAVSVLCFGAVAAKAKLGYDDSLDTFGVHGVGGTVGALLTGIFASAAIQAGKTGLLEGNAHQLWVQAVGVAAVVAYSIVVSFVLLRVLDAVMGLRVSRDDEIMGLDLSQHGEEAYDLSAA
jgi:Amt family ammonium transporter